MCAAVGVFSIPFGPYVWSSKIIHISGLAPNLIGGWEVPVSLGRAIMHKPSSILWILLAVGAIGYIATKMNTVSKFLKFMVNSFINGNLLLAGACYLAMYLTGDWEVIELGHIFLAIALAFTLYSIFIWAREGLQRKALDEGSP